MAEVGVILRKVFRQRKLCTFCCQIARDSHYTASLKAVAETVEYDPLMDEQKPFAKRKIVHGS